MHSYRKAMYMIPTYLAISIKKLIEYKTAMYAMVLNQTLAAGLWLIFWQALFNNIQSIGPWQFKDMVLLTGFVIFNTSLWFMFLAIWRLPMIIMKGELGMSLIRPVPTLWHIIGKEFNLIGIPRIAIAIIIFIIAFTTLNIPFNATLMLLALIVSFLSFIITIFPFLLICLSTFWIGRADFARDLFTELSVFENYPLTVFPKGIALFFTALFPVIFSGTMPVLIMTTFSLKQTTTILIIEVIIFIAQLIIVQAVWEKGLARYESYGG